MEKIINCKCGKKLKLVFEVPRLGAVKSSDVKYEVPCPFCGKVTGFAVSLVKMERARRNMLIARKALEDHVAMMREKLGWDAEKNAVLFDLLKVTTDEYLSSVSSVLKEQREEIEHLLAR